MEKYRSNAGVLCGRILSGALRVLRSKQTMSMFEEASAELFRSIVQFCSVI